VEALKIKAVACHSDHFAKGRAGMSPEGIVVHVMDGGLVGTDAYFAQSKAQRTAAAREAFLAKTKRTPADLAAAQRINIGASATQYGIGTPWKQPGKLEIHQYVKDEDTAYHAGAVASPTWKRLKPFVNPNLYTIGIEHEGTGTSAWGEPMYALSARLIRTLCDRWRIPVTREYIVGHREIYAPRACPGRCDLEYLVKLAAAL
jgi:N-acetylmuramoyl-L-alanine amidase